ENIEANVEQAHLCKRLVTIHTEVPITEKPDDLIRRKLNEDKLSLLFAEFEFTTFSKRLFGKVPAPTAHVAPPTDGQGDLFAFASQQAAAAPVEPEEPVFKTIDDVKHRYHLVQTREERAALAKKIGEGSACCFDVETTGLDPRKDKLIGIAFAIQPHEAWYVTLPPDDEEIRKALEPFAAIFANEGIEKTGHNLKFDIAMLREAGIEVNGKLFDTMIAHYLLDPDQRHGLDRLAGSFLHYAPVPITALIGEKKKDQLSMTDVPLDQLSDYACEDADVTLQLKEILAPELVKRKLKMVFDTIECPLIPVLVEMEANGVALDTGALGEISIKLAEKIDTYQKQIFEFAGREFNLNSPKQLGEVLFDEMHLIDKPKKTKTVQYSTNEEVLQKLADDHEIIRTILDYRGATKLKSTYVDALPQEVFPKSGRVHTTFRQAVTTTGRLSSVNPNLQNIPIRTEEGREIRRAFIPREGFTLLACDYSQIELRIMAELSGDEHLREAFIHG
ncbi:MAG: DNA polymerase I, partial [Verrucomicrobia bacterium]|nr:DNA polymerase I [Verrucomicrobiota bacterium]